MAPVAARDAARLRAEIAHELTKLEKTLGEIVARRDATDDTTTYALAMLLMNYYTGSEHVFRRIAALFGGLPPGGDRWHVQLLEDMELDLPGIRPPLLANATIDELSRLLRFRHVARNLYAWTLRRSEMEPLLAHLHDVHAALAGDVGRFLAFLDRLAADEA